MKQAINKILDIFIIMPFGVNGEYKWNNDESNHVYDKIISPSLNAISSNLKCEVRVVREVDRNASGQITKRIIESLAKADIVIADLTGKNPNVFLELGVRYSLRNKTTILMTQSDFDIPFDIKNYRYILYNPFRCEEAIKKIEEYVVEGMKEHLYSDSIVFDALPDMSVILPTIENSYGKKVLDESKRMRWEDFYKKIEDAIGILTHKSGNITYEPDIIFGISSGGLAAADYISREAFKKIPIISLNVKRGTKVAIADFMDPFNNAIVDVLKEQKKNDIVINVLAIDDHLGTGQTILAAKRYLDEKLEGKLRMLYFPICSRNDVFTNEIEEILPFNYKEHDTLMFNLTREQFIKMLLTDSQYFPYLKKEIHLAPR